MRKYLLLALLALCTGASLSSCSSSTTTANPSGYATTVVTANRVGFQASNVDSNLVNPWGLIIAPGGAFWTADNGTGMTSHYDSTGTVKSTPIRIPGVSGAAGKPTGAVYNTDPASFAIPGTGTSLLLYATEDGTIAAWGAFGGDSATVLVNRKPTSIFKGLAMGTSNGSSVLYAANFLNQTVDVFSSTFGFLGGSSNPNIPSTFAPFNVAVLNNQLYVTYAMRSATNDDIPGVGNGYIDVFDMSGKFVKAFAAQGTLNAPWGMTIAPGNFGDFSGKLLVGNFGDGTINAYDASSGSYAGQLKDASGNVLKIDGLWSLATYNGKVYYTAGPNKEADGAFGVITLK